MITREFTVRAVKFTIRRGNLLARLEVYWRLSMSLQVCKSLHTMREGCRRGGRRGRRGAHGCPHLAVAPHTEYLSPTRSLGRPLNSVTRSFGRSVARAFGQSLERSCAASLKSTVSCQEMAPTFPPLGRADGPNKNNELQITGWNAV